MLINIYSFPINLILNIKYNFILIYIKNKILRNRPDLIRNNCKRIPYHLPFLFNF